MADSIFTISAAEKENKIAKVAHLIPKWYAEDSIVNEPAIVLRISKLLKPNQWLRIEDNRYGKYDYSQPINYNKQPISMKPTGIWASKGEWSFHGDRQLTLIEVDYSRILVLTTKEDYLEFEDKYCKKVLRYNKTKKELERSRKTRKSRRWDAIDDISRNNRTITKQNKTIKKQKLVCIMNVNWNAVSKDYNGIAMVPFGKPYFDIKEMLEYKNHLWVASYDVSSLVIWRHNGTTPITNAISLGTTDKLYKLADGDSKLDSKKVVQVIKQGIT